MEEFKEFNSLKAMFNFLKRKGVNVRKELKMQSTHYNRIMKGEQRTLHKKMALHLQLNYKVKLIVKEPKEKKTHVLRIYNCRESDFYKFKNMVSFFGGDSFINNMAVRVAFKALVKYAKDKKMEIPCDLI